MDKKRPLACEADGKTFLFVAQELAHEAQGNHRHSQEVNSPPEVSAMNRILLASGLLGVLAIAVPTTGQDKTAPGAPVPAENKDFPPGWFPISTLDDQLAWQQVRDADEKEPRPRLYLPPGVKSVRGVFLCFQFHSADPRHMGRLWDFAVVTVPWPLEYDIGVNDKRSGRYKLGHPVGNTGYLLKYLEIAAKETNHPELATAPIVGWLMQNGVRHLKDLHARAPDRIVAWSDGWPNQMKEIPGPLAKVPFAYAWELGSDVKERQAAFEKAGDTLKDKLTPAPDLSARASTYGFKHGVYSKYGFFVAYLDRCIRAKVPAGPLPADFKLTPWVKEDGWVGDFNPQSEWAPIAPYKEAKGMIAPVWLPDEYAAWVWRAYHSAKPDLKVTAPVTEYHGGDRSDCGVGYSKPTPAGTPVRVAAEVKGTYAKVEFYDGNKLLGTANKAPYGIDGIRFEKGLHALIAVGVGADGKRVSSRPAFLGVE